MKLIQVHITAAPDNNPSDAHTYAWYAGAPLAHLDVAIAKLTECLGELRSKENDPTAAQNPIEP